MPKTRNVTRSQWDVANASTTSTRNRNENENSHDSEKENAGRQATRVTRLHTRSHSRATALGTSNTTILAASTGSKVMGEKRQTASNGKGKPSKAPLKRKKMPLQDITDQFLPAPEAANRGEETDNVSAHPEENINGVMATIPPSEAPNTLPPPPPKFTSPLPPSSPPSELTVSPVLEPEPSAPNLLDAFTFSIPQEPYDPWQEFEDAHALSEDNPANASSHSDPFGFVSLERKLKAERETATLLAPDQDQDLEEDIHVLVADTSSPRPVRRLKRSLRDGSEHEAIAEFVPAHPHYTTPPTPHKDKQKRRRMSHEGHDIFSPCASSIESSPSPLKVSSRKRPRPDMHNGLDEFNEKLDRSYEVEVTLKKARSSKQIQQAAKDEEGSADLQGVFRNLRPRELRRSPEKDQIETKPSNTSGKGKGAKKPVSKSRPASSKSKEKAEASDNEEENLDEKWEQERQGRIEYFKRLEEYHVEKEDVYLI